MKPGNGKSCPVCGSELKPLFSSFFCARCEQAKKAAPSDTYLTAQEVVNMLAQVLPLSHRLCDQGGQFYVRWGDRDWVTITVEYPGLMGTKDFLTMFMPGSKIPKGMVEGYLRMLGAWA